MSAYSHPLTVSNESTPLRQSNTRNIYYDYGQVNELFIRPNPCPCLCGTVIPDYMYSLTRQERIIRLTEGYVRIYSKSKRSQRISSDIIHTVLLPYVGDTDGFGRSQLASNKELNRISCMICCCCRCTFEVSSLKVWKENAINLGKILLVSICVVLSFGKDIWALNFIASSSDNACDHLILSKHSHGVIEVALWIWTGSLVHIFTAAGNLFFWCLDRGSIFECTVCTFIVGYLFCFAWIIIGYILYGEMEKNDECAVVVIAWSILQTTEFILVIGFLSAICFGYVPFKNGV